MYILVLWAVLWAGATNGPLSPSGVARDFRFAEHDVDVAHNRQTVVKPAAVARQGVRLRVSPFVVLVLGAANRARGRAGRFRASVPHGWRWRALRKIVHRRQ